jgi:hypothetical protein
MPVPSKNHSLDASVRYLDITNFLNCMGCLDGKYCHIKCPSQALSLFINYKEYIFLVLLATGSTDCTFICINVDACGTESDSSEF